MKRVRLYLQRAFSSLRLRLLLLVLLVCAPLVALILHTAGADRRRAAANWQQHSQKLLQVAQQDEEQLIGETRQLLLAISEAEDVRALRSRSSTKLLKDLFASYPRYSNLGVIKASGEVLASAQPFVPFDSVTNQPFFRQAIEGGFTIGNHPRPQSDSGQPCLRFGYPIFDAEGQAVGVVFAEVDLRAFYKFSSDLPMHLPKGATWSQIDADGQVLVRYPQPEHWLGRAVPETALVKTAFAQQDLLYEETDARGVTTVYAFDTTNSPLWGAPVATMLSIRRQNLFSAADRVLYRNLSWLGVAAGLALALGLLASRMLILQPLNALVRSTARVAAGDLAVRTGLPYRSGELGRLTLAFDRMAQALEERELERQRAGQKLLALSSRLVEVQEAERRHIARELHDEIGQSLTAAEMNLQAALRSDDAAALERRLQAGIEAVERVLEQVHDLSLNLRPSMLDDLGLESALRWYTHRQAELTGLQAQFKADPLEERLDPLIETECFRVAQEALTNIVRHAQARAVWVELVRREDQLHLTVRDDGVGFDVTAQRTCAVQGASLGLLSMEERATLAGGRLELTSTPGRGTEVRASFPLKWRTEQTTIELHE